MQTFGTNSRSLSVINLSLTRAQFHYTLYGMQNYTHFKQFYEDCLKQNI